MFNARQMLDRLVQTAQRMAPPDVSASLQQKGGQIKYCMRRVAFVIFLFLSETVTSSSMLKVAVEFLMLDFNGCELIQNEEQVKNYL